MMATLAFNELKKFRWDLVKIPGIMLVEICLHLLNLISFVEDEDALISSLSDMAYPAFEDVTAKLNNV